MEYLLYLLKNTVFILIAARIVVIAVVTFAIYRLVLHSNWFKRFKNQKW